jgi:phosphatidate phosphatase APP1
MEKNLESSGRIMNLSGSPQNYYERINDFLRLHKFPAGPLLLKNFGTDPLFDQRGLIRDWVRSAMGTRAPIAP